MQPEDGTATLNESGDLQSPQAGAFLCNRHDVGNNVPHGSGNVKGRGHNGHCSAMNRGVSADPREFIDEFVRRSLFVPVWGGFANGSGKRERMKQFLRRPSGKDEHFSQAEGSDLRRWPA